MKELKGFKFASFNECKGGGVTVPIKFDSMESASVCISNLIDALNLIAEQGDNFDHRTPEEVLTPVRGITEVLKGLYNENLLYDIPLLDKVRAMQNK
ncbi:MAG: hypothetical protein N4A71_02485 [Carboxylicivirga sp.]|jgi:hypothetical protein|nr:hypothetical protein [Carboxylicivirga sp.]